MESDIIFHAAEYGPFNLIKLLPDLKFIYCRKNESVLDKIN
jgi:hypothetical protein